MRERGVNRSKRLLEFEEVPGEENGILSRPFETLIREQNTSVGVKRNFVKFGSFISAESSTLSFSSL